MADVKFSQFTNGNNLQTGDQVVGLRGGVNTIFLVNSILNHYSAFPVYVSPDGSNVTGNGKINNPYATIAFAISSISSASSSNQYKIVCSYGVYNETTLTLKPWMSIDGQGSTLNVTGNIVQDASWSSGGQLNFGNFSVVNISGNLSLNLSSSTTNSCILNLYDMEFSSISGFSVVGGDQTILILDNLTSIPELLNISLENVNGDILNSNVSSFTYLSDHPSFSFNFPITRTIIGGSVSYTTSGGGVGVDCFISDSKILGSLTATGTNTSLTIDSSSLNSSTLPVLSGGATASYINVANTMLANYSPVNYIPDGSGTTSPVGSIASHLHGIDNALSNISNSNNYVYVSNTGSNVTGNGSFDKPYATTAFAMNSITTASVSNTFTIVLIGGEINEPVQIQLKPFVSISGLNSSVILNMSSDMILHSSWNTASSPISVLNNFSFLTSNINFDGTSYTNNTTALVFVNNVQSFLQTVTVKGSSNFDLEMYIDNCIFFRIFYSNSLVELASSIISNSVICNSGKTDAALRPAVGFFLGNRLGNVIINSLSSGPTTSCTFYSNQIESLRGDGQVVELLIDVGSFTNNLSLFNSATYSLINNSGGLDANYTPVNYSPNASAPYLSTSVLGHLAGIDIAFGKIGILNINSVVEVLTTSQSVNVGTEYIANNASLVNFSLPATVSQGSKVRIMSKGAGGWRLTANVGQTIRVGNAVSSSGGTVTSTASGDSITLTCITANTSWEALSSIGAFTIT